MVPTASAMKGMGVSIVEISLAGQTLLKWLSTTLEVVFLYLVREWHI